MASETSSSRRMVNIGETSQHREVMSPIESAQIELHGHRVNYRLAGQGPLIVLVHGITSTSESWREVMGWLADDFTVLAPDLLGHGESAKPRGDYSLGAYASGIRDLIVALGYERGTFLGHSLGGGVAMQLAYQFPERCERMVLVSSGGLGPEVHFLLRAAALPGAEWILPLIVRPGTRDFGRAVGRLLSRVGVRPTADLAEFARGYGSLEDADARQAFVHTLRAVIDPAGQRVSARDRLYLAAEVPSLVIWGERDRIIPIEHGRRAHEEMPGSRFIAIPDAGHFPQLDQPRRFVEALVEFMADTKPSRLDAADLRKRLLAGSPHL
jgi:pimeloyl-ACP methyl ester carboxylesterase